MNSEIWNLLTNFEVHDISDLNNHCAVEFSVKAQIKEKEEIKRGNNLFMNSLFDALVTPISEYGIEQRGKHEKG